MKHIVILISGRGSNMQAIAHACAREQWPARIVAVISSRPDAQGLDAARALGLTTVVVDHRAHPERAGFDTELARSVAGFAPDLVVLAGFMRILDDAFVTRYAGRMLNVHPSLLPAFPGLHTHRRALEAGCKVSGATVHFVTPALDHGPIVAQVAVVVRAGDDEQSLAGRVLAAEHPMLARAVRWFVEDRLRIEDDGRVVQLDGEPQAWWAGNSG